MVRPRPLFREDKESIVKAGDIIKTDGHIVMVYSDRYDEFKELGNLKTVAGNDVMYEVVHAFGNNSYSFDGLTLDFARKVAITGDNYSDKTKTFGRIKFWD